MSMKELHAPSGGVTTRIATTAAPRALAVAVGLLFAPGGIALAQQPQSPPSPPAAQMPQTQTPSSRGFGQAPRTAKYEDVATQRSFVLDRSGEEPLMKFDDSPEVFVLRSTTAQRGDAFLRNDAGQLMLRVTEPGNVISYVGDEDGAPADISGSAAPLVRPGMTTTLAVRVKDASARLTELAGHDVTIFGAQEFAREEAWVADALMLMVFGFEQAASASAKAPAKVTGVRIAKTATPGVVVEDGELVLGLNPAEGYAGRPSSAAIAKVILSAKK
jgi:hypothetical protein